MKKKGFPKEGQLAACTITQIQPHCAWVTLDEYEDLKGMIHVSEVASSWIRNIRNFIRDDQHLVCRVLSVDERSGHINLSKKRVTEAEMRKKLDSVRKERRAEKWLEFAAKKMGVPFEQAYDTIGKQLEDEFGEMYLGFEEAARGKDLSIDPKWNKAIQEVAKQNVTFSTYTVSKDICLTSEKPNGVEHIKQVLKAMADSGVLVHYISAPNYKVTLTGEDRKQVAVKLQKICQTAVEQIEAIGGCGEVAK